MDEMEKVLANVLPNRRRASSGLRWMIYALTKCSSLSLYGFYPFSKDCHGGNVAYHYWNNKDFASGVHDMAEEFEIYLILNATMENFNLRLPPIGSCHGFPADPRRYKILHNILTPEMECKWDYEDDSKKSISERLAALASAQNMTNSSIPEQ